MTSGPIVFASANASIRALVSLLLSTEQVESLLTSPNLDEALQRLLATAYGPRLAGTIKAKPSLITIERTLESELVKTFEQVALILSGTPRVLVVQMARSFEISNVKTILRGLEAKAHPEEIEARLLPSARFQRLPIKDLLNAGDVREAIEAILRTGEWRSLWAASARYKKEGSLFPIELALDVEYYRQVWKALSDLDERDRVIAKRMLGMVYDITNVDWVLRYRLTYNVPPEELLNYTIPMGFRLDDHIIRKMSVASDVGSIVDVLPNPYQDSLRPIVNQASPIHKANVALNRLVSRSARNQLAGYPFTIGTPISFLLLRQAEVHDLKSILEGLRHNYTPDAIRTHLWGYV